MNDPVTPEEREIVARQLGRPPRALVAVAHRCPCGQPDVVETSPRLEDGTPFPTLYYLTCPRAVAAASRLESTGRMREWQDELGRGWNAALFKVGQSTGSWELAARLTALDGSPLEGLEQSATPPDEAVPPSDAPAPALDARVRRCRLHCDNDASYLPGGRPLPPGS